MCQMKIFLFSQPTNCGKSRSLKLIISGNGWFFIWIIKPPSPDNTSGKGGSSFFEMEHDYQWLIHKVKLFAFETIWWRRGVQWYNHLFATFQNGKSPKLLDFFRFFYLIDLTWLRSWCVNGLKIVTIKSTACF